jgi:hypothetical protein
VVISTRSPCRALADLLQHVVDLVEAGRTSTIGSTSPVGRTSCSTTWPACVFS